MFFNSVKEINRLKKEIYKLLSTETDSGLVKLNISCLDSSVTAEINVFIVHGKHEDLSL